MIDSKVTPKPGEGNTNNKKGPGLQKEEPGAALPDGAPDLECLKDKDQVRARTTEARSATDYPAQLHDPSTHLCATAAPPHSITEAP